MSTLITPIEPATAREVLAAFFPTHAMHTVIRCHHGAHQFDLVCGCGGTVLKVYELDIKVKGWSVETVGYALRNVPLEPKAA